MKTLKQFISVVLVFLRGVVDWLRMLLSEGGNNIISLLIILLFYFIIWEFPQAIDLLLIFNQIDITTIWHIPLYYALLVILGTIIWIAPAYFDPRVYRNLTIKSFFSIKPFQTEIGKSLKGRPIYLSRLHVQKTMPKVLGSLLIIISSTGILNAYEQTYNSIPLLTSAGNYLSFTVVLFLLLLIYPIYKWFLDLFSKIPRNKWILYLLIILGVVTLILLGILNDQDKDGILKLFISNSVLAFVFLSFTFLFRRIRSDITKNTIYRVVLVLVIAVLIYYVLIAIKPAYSQSLNPLLVILISLIAFYVLAFALKLTGKRYKIPLLTLFIIICFVIGEMAAKKDGFDHYAIEPVPATIKDRSGIDEHIQQWFEQRKEQIINSQQHYPIILVSAEGGGSRAGLWSFLVHSYLQNSSPDYFTDHLFLLTGASGGSVGNSMFYARASELFKNPAPYSYLTEEDNGFLYKASVLYNENFLSSSVAGLLGRDLLQSIANRFSYDDRGRLLEEEWEQAHFKHISHSENDPLLAREFLSFYQSGHNGFSPPLLIINTTHVQSGQYFLISPVSFDITPEFDGLNDFLSEMQAAHPGSSLMLSTAMSLNARFPYISPAGRVNKLGQFVDSGYYDNIGGSVSSRVKSRIKAYLDALEENDSLLRDKIRIIDLVIKYKGEDKSAKPVTQLRAPLSTLLNVRSGHTREIETRLDDEFVIELDTTRIALEPIEIKRLIEKQIASTKDSITPVLPLGRFLSKSAINSIEERLGREPVRSRLEKLVEYMDKP